MPELPEVETVVRTLRPQVLECCIERVEVLRERSLHPLSLPVERLAGTRISAAVAGASWPCWIWSRPPWPLLCLCRRFWPCICA